MIYLKWVIVMAKDELYMSCCPKCGDVGDDLNICPYCGEKQIRTKYTLIDLLEQDDIDDEKIVDEYARCSPLFDEDLYRSRINKEKLLQKATLDKQREQNKPKCPICQSTNLSKITTAQKAGKIALFGIFGMGDNGKTWKCNNCGSKF